MTTQCQAFSKSSVTNRNQRNFQFHIVIIAFASFFFVEESFSRTAGDKNQVEQFIFDMNRKHGFSKSNLTKKFRLHTVKPGFVNNFDGKIQSPHILISISSRGLNMTLNTRIYFEGDDLTSDPLLSTVRNSRNDVSSLVAKKIDEDIFLFDIFLQGDKETIFLDI